MRIATNEPAIGALGRNARPLPTSNEVKREGLGHNTRSGAGVRQRVLVLSALRDHGPATRQDLVERIGIPLSSVCGRCGLLLDSQFIEVIDTEGTPARQVLAITAKGREHLLALTTPAEEVTA